MTILGTRPFLIHTPSPQHEPLPRPAVLELNPLDPGSLSIQSLNQRGHSASEANHGSVGDFHDTYYRQPMMAQRAGGAGQRNAGQARGANGRPPPLKLNGASGLSTQTIAKVPRPGPGPMVWDDRYPNRF